MTPSSQKQMVLLHLKERVKTPARLVYIARSNMKALQIKNTLPSVLILRVFIYLQLINETGTVYNICMG